MEAANRQNQTMIKHKVSLMAKRNRSTLRNYFRAGAMPNEDHFNDLIDSTLNTLEEGFDKTAEHGLKISSLENKANLVTFYRDTMPKNPLWAIKYHQQSDTLNFTAQAQNIQSKVNDNNPLNKPSQSVLSLSQAGRIGVNNAEPLHTLDVKGVIKTDGLVGTSLHNKAIPADGHWHNISEKLEGCQAFDVVLGVGIKRSGRYALLKACAMNTCAPVDYLWGLITWKKPIKSQQAHYRSSADKIKLRWVTAPKDIDDNLSYRPYYLQAKTNTSYGDGVFIRGHITRLWFDEYMQDSIVDDNELTS